MLRIGMILCMLLLLSGCDALLERDFAETKRHSVVDTAEDSAVLQVQDYHDLVSALIYLVGAYEEVGTLRFYEYVSSYGSAEQDLDVACLEVSQTDPLAAYGVDYMLYHMTPLGSSVQGVVSIAYSRTAAELAAVRSVTGSSAIQGEVRENIADFERELVLRVNYAAAGLSPQYVQMLVEEAYYELPGAGCPMPTATVTLYPELSDSRNRVVEVLLDYGGVPREELEARKTLLAKTATSEGLAYADMEEADVVDAVAKRVGQIPEGAGRDAYAALVEGAASEEGRMLAAMLLLQQSGIEVHFVRGVQGDHLRHWLMVQADEAWQHFVYEGGQIVLMDDAALSSLGYVWRDELPDSVVLDAAADVDVDTLAEELW